MESSNLGTDRPTNSTVTTIGSASAPLRPAIGEIDRDGLIANLLVCLAFFALCLNRLGTPEILHYDEPWYVVAAASFLKDFTIENREHPMFAKEMIALFFWLFDGSWVSARIGSVIFGTVGLFGFQRALYIVSGSRSASTIFGILIATNCLYFVTARTAFLDPYMLGLTGIALAFLAKGIVESSRRLAHFILAGSAIGLAMASKWTVAPIAICMAISTILRFAREPRTILALGTAALSAAVICYTLTFLPVFLTPRDPIALADFISFHRAMAFHLSTLIGQHPYQSSWWQWPIGSGQMWFYAGKYTGVDRAIVLAQNPVATLLSLPAVGYGLYVILVRRDWRLGGPALAYLVAMAFWVITHKPNMFIYHYNIPSIFALSIVAQVMVRPAGRVGKGASAASIAAYVGAFVYFYPVMSAAELDGRLVEITDRYGWAENPNAARERGLVGNGKEMQLWANRCLLAPSRHECAELRRNTLDR